MRMRYGRILLLGSVILLFLVLIDWVISPNRSPRIVSPQTEFLEEHFTFRHAANKSDGQSSSQGGNPRNDGMEDEQFLPVGRKFWRWLPRASGLSESSNWHQDMSKITQMKRTLNSLNTNTTTLDNPLLLSILRNFWLRPPSTKPYQLEYPELRDFSKGQSGIVDEILHQQEKGFFVECGALDGETRSNTLFFERERGWSGLLIETGPLNYRKLVKKQRKAYSSPACLGIHTFPTKMYFHRGKNRGRLIESKEALDWVHRQAMNVWLMEVQCFPLASLLLALNRTRVDYFSLDVEGVELDVLQTVPWERFDVRVLTVEFAHDRAGKDALQEYMESQGYVTVTEVTREDGLANDLVFKKHMVSFE